MAIRVILNVSDMHYRFPLMLALRILRADDWWEDFWNQRTERLLAA